MHYRQHVFEFGFLRVVCVAALPLPKLKVNYQHNQNLLVHYCPKSNKAVLKQSNTDISDCELTLDNDAGGMLTMKPLAVLSPEILQLLSLLFTKRSTVELFCWLLGGCERTESLANKNALPGIVAEQR